MKQKAPSRAESEDGKVLEGLGRGEEKQCDGLREWGERTGSG